jgi:hypothetical protein
MELSNAYNACVLVRFSHTTFRGDAILLEPRKGVQECCGMIGMQLSEKYMSRRTLAFRAKAICQFVLVISHWHCFNDTHRMSTTTHR